MIWPCDSSLVIVAAGSCDRSCQRAIAPNTFLREVPLTAIREQLCPVVADTDLSGANSSPPGPLNPRHRVADLETA